jgi:hypothetical protein
MGSLAATIFSLTLSLLITLSQLSEYLQQQPPLSPSNLYRKQYGNLEHAFNYESNFFNSIFLFENGIVLKLLDIDSLQKAVQLGNFTASLLTKCQSMHAFKRAHDIQTLKINSKNTCKRCGKDYAVLVNSSKACGGHDHEPTHNFEVEEDPFNLG